MSLPLATKGIINVIKKTIYVPVDKPDMTLKELKPKMRADQKN